LAYMFRPIRPSSGHQSLRTPRIQLVKINKNLKSGVVCAICKMSICYIRIELLKVG
jgi:hypothetical protein